MPLFCPQIIIVVIMVIDNTLCFTKVEYRFPSRAVVFLNKLVRGASLPPGANASRCSFVPRRQKVERSPPPSRTPTAGAAGDSVPRDGRRHGGGATRAGGGSRLRPAVIRRRLSGAAAACGGRRRAGEPPRRLGAAAGLPNLVPRPRFEALSASGGSEGRRRSCRRAARPPRRRAGSSASLSLGGGGRHGAVRFLTPAGRRRACSLPRARRGFSRAGRKRAVEASSDAALSEPVGRSSVW